MEEFLKVMYGLNGNSGDNTGGWVCHRDVKNILFPRYFYECNRANEQCTLRHALTATSAGGPYLDGTESQKEALRALTPSWAAAMADGTLKKLKVPKKSGKGN